MGSLLWNHLGDIWEASGRHLGDIWEASERHLGSSGRALGELWEVRGAIRHLGGSQLIKVVHLSAKMQKLY